MNLHIIIECWSIFPILIDISVRRERNAYNQDKHCGYLIAF